MFSERHQHYPTLDRDSLDDESLKNQQQLQDNDNNYDFLYDEEYQRLNLDKETLLQKKWNLICDKVAFCSQIKSINELLGDMNDSLQQQCAKQEALLSDYEVSTSYNQNQRGRVPMSYKDLKVQLQTQASSIMHRVSDLVDNSNDLCRKFSKQQLQIEQQQQQIHRLSIQTKESEADLHQESYIEEIETQLQESRANLLDKKLKLADQEEEITALKKQIETMQRNYESLDLQKREIDELVIRVSQEFKNKEMDVRDFNYQVALEKEHFQKQIDLLNRELQEEMDRKVNLELTESELISKLQNSEKELEETRLYIQEMEEKLEVKTDAIEKAQKVIQKLSERFERTSDQLQQTEMERDSLRQQCKELGKKVQDLNAQIQSNMNFHNQTNMQVNAQLKQEIEELKDALQQYQSEYDQEKRHLSETVKSLNEQKYNLQIEKEKGEGTIRLMQAKLQQSAEDKDVEIQKLEAKAAELKKEMDEKEAEFRQQVELKEQQARSNLQYLQKRLKEAQYEAYRGSASKGGDQKIDPNSLLVTLKQEFDKVQSELFQVKATIKTQFLDQDILNRLEGFDDYKRNVFDQLFAWETKILDLTEQVQKHQNTFDEQRKLFQALRQTVKEKDQLIYSYQKQLQQRAQTAKVHVGTIKSELDRSHYLIKADLMDLVKSFDQENHLIREDNYHLDHRFQTFKHEFAQILEEREQVKNENLHLKGSLEIQKRDLEKATEDMYALKERIKVILDIRMGGVDGHNLIFSELEAVMDELRVRKDEVIHYKAQIQDYSQQSEQEKQFLLSRIKSVEDQLDVIQRQSLSKEEEQQISYLQKETRYINEMQKLQSELTAQINETQIRERQLKKLQIKHDSVSSQNEQFLGEIENLQKQLQTLMDREHATYNELVGIQEVLEKTQVDLDDKIRRIGDMNDQIRVSEDKYAQLRERMSETDIAYQSEIRQNQSLKEQLSQLQHAHEQSEDKVRILERENDTLFMELQRSKDESQSWSYKYDQAEGERLNLQNAYEQMTQVVQEAQEQIVHSQQSIESLSKALEKAKDKDYEISGLQYEVRMLKRNEVEKDELIEQLQFELNPEVRSVDIQTSDSGMQEILYLREEFSRLKKDRRQSQKEAESVKDVNERLTMEIDRLINEKRDLEQFIDQQNQNIKSIKMQQAFKENTNMSNSLHLKSTQYQSFNSANNDLLQQILREKENYIGKLEFEIGEMRKENEYLQEKIIMHEVGTLTLQQPETDKSVTLRVKHSQNKGTGQQSLNLSNIINQSTYKQNNSNYYYNEDENRYAHHQSYNL